MASGQGPEEKALLAALREKGYRFRSIDQLFSQNKPLPAVACYIIMERLPALFEEHIGTGDCAMRSLIVAEEPIDPALLIAIYENPGYNFSIRSGAAIVLAHTKTADISNWIKDQLLHNDDLFTASGLLDAVKAKCGFRTRQQLLTFLKKLFDRYLYYNYYCSLFQKYATKDDLPFLKNKALREHAPRKKKDIEKIIRKITARKKDNPFP